MNTPTSSFLAAAAWALSALAGCATTAPPATRADMEALRARVLGLEAEVRALRSERPPDAASRPDAFVCPDGTHAEAASVERLFDLFPTGEKTSSWNVQQCIAADGHPEGPVRAVPSLGGEAVGLARGSYFAGAPHGSWLIRDNLGVLLAGTFDRGRPTGAWVERVRFAPLARLHPTTREDRPPTYPDPCELGDELPRPSIPRLDVGLPRFLGATDLLALTYARDRLEAALRSGDLDLAAATYAGLPLDLAAHGTVPDGDRDSVRFGANEPLTDFVDSSGERFSRGDALTARGSFEDGQRVGAWHVSALGPDALEAGTFGFAVGKLDGPWSAVLGGVTFTGTYAAGVPTGQTLGRSAARDEVFAVDYVDGLPVRLAFPPTAGYALSVKHGHYDGPGRVVTWGGEEYRFTMRNGRLDGPWTKTSPRGARTELRFAAGVVDGPFEQSTPAPPGGPTRWQGAFCKGQRCGRWRGSLADALRIEVHYREGRPHGRATLWQDDGALACTASYDAGELDGPFEQRTRDGVLRGRYAHGQRSGPWVEGTAQGSYDEGLRDGRWQQCLDLPRWKAACGTVDYREGQLEGPFALSGKGFRLEGELRTVPGVAPEYEESALQPELRATHHEVLDGPFTVHVGEVVAAEGRYTLGKRVGVWLARDEDGKLTDREDCDLPDPSRDCRRVASWDADGTQRTAFERTAKPGLFRWREWDWEGALTRDQEVDAANEPCGASEVRTSRDRRVVGHFDRAAGAEACTMHGRFTTTSADGSTEVSHYDHGVKAGRWEWRDASGQVTRWVEYRDGAEVAAGP